MKNSMRFPKELLKACPFCGGKAHIAVYDVHSYRVICNDCAVCTADQTSVFLARQLWNNRVGEAKNNDKVSS